MNTSFDPCLTGIEQEEQYELFQEWLNDCPLNITNYQDFTDEFEITFTFKKNDQLRCIPPMVRALSSTI